MACITECGSVRIVTVRPKSASVRGSSASKTYFQPRSHNSTSAARVFGASSNSPSRLRSGFSPSVVRKSIHRERAFPAMCFTIMAMEFDSESITANKFSSEHCPMARSASFLLYRNRSIESFTYEVVNWCAITPFCSWPPFCQLKSLLVGGQTKQRLARLSSEPVTATWQRGPGGVRKRLTIRFLFAYDIALRNLFLGGIARSQKGIHNSVV